jgi:hypothetical protein
MIPISDKIKGKQDDCLVPAMGSALELLVRKRRMDTMFQKTDFWIGLAVGAVAGIFGYRFMQEREQQMAAMQPAAPAGEIPLAELQRQKEELEDLIAAQQAKKN